MTKITYGQVGRHFKPPPSSVGVEQFVFMVIGPVEDDHPLAQTNAAYVVIIRGETYGDNGIRRVGDVGPCWINENVEWLDDD